MAPENLYGLSFLFEALEVLEKLKELNYCNEKWRRPIETVMNIDTIRLVFDTGLFVLIWLVQLVIYPGFRHYSKANLIVWHKKYTRGISLVVIPLMFGQLISAALQWSLTANSYTLGSMVLIAGVWLTTFLKFVPMHNVISKGLFDDELLIRLIKHNWLRTALWTVLFGYSILTHL